MDIASLETVPTVLIATDGSDVAEEAVAWAAEQAHVRNTRLVILTSVSPTLSALEATGQAYGAMSVPEPDLERAHKDAAADMVVAEAKRIARRYPDLTIEPAVFVGDPREALKAYARNTALVVLGSRGRGPWRTALLGSVSFWATRHLDVPLAIVRPRTSHYADHFSRVVVGVTSDGSSTETLRFAFADAQRRALELIVANCRWDTEARMDHWRELPPDAVDPETRATLEAQVRQIAKDYPEVRYSLLFARGQVDRFLADLGGRSSLLVVGRHASSGWDFIGLGTVASSVIEHACGVTLVVPSSD